MSRLLLRVCDFLLLSAAAGLFGACLTAVLRTGSYGLQIPDAPYTYELADFVVDAMLAGLAATAALALAEWRWRGRISALRRAALVFVAALLAIYLGPPEPVVFGNTWARWEPTIELFLAQWDIALPLALAAAAASWVVRGVAGARG
ncbi:hypothetical protein [Achromobacter xylosoxidans]|uniref:hypothetical protein n=1 Tax=Alcaligenes xylosoxydans xylosoxydans TaxID=85698 RepID=UPI001F12CA01|nr:hypothetical protein [Achromobacter xylosoxidans]